MVTVFTSPTCAPCKVAKRRLESEGVAYEAVDLTESPDVLQELKGRLKREFVQTPLFEFRGELYDMTSLRDIIERAKADG